MKKYLYLVPLALLGLAPLAASATAVNLSGVDIALPNGITISVAGSQSQADSVTINQSNVSFTMSEGEAMYIVSTNRYTLTNSLGISTTCGSSQSSVDLVVHSGEGTKTITVTPSTSLCNSGGASGGGSEGGIIVSGGGGGGGGGGSAYVSPKPAAPATTPAAQVASPVVQQTPAAAVSPVFNKNLVIGSRGDDVTRLQMLLSQDPSLYPEKILSGRFGPKTVAAVKRFQKKYGITPVNGRVGPKTRAKLKEVFGTAGVTAVPAAPVAASTPAVPAQVQAPASVPATSNQIVVQLKEQNSSGQSGTATLTQIDGTASVKIEVVRTGPAPLVDTPQPAHIHRGNCGELGNVTYSLSALVNGKSITTLPVTLDTLLTQLPLAVNIHKSVSEAQIYVACGNIVK